MSTFEVTVEPVTIHEHPNADALELAQVGLYRAVVVKGQFRTGDYALYIPGQAVLPDALIAELGLEGKLAGKRHNRVKAVRLRGELSQGIVCLSFEIDLYVDLKQAHEQRWDIAADLGITKWQPEVPAHLDGVVLPAGDLLPWVEV